MDENIINKKIYSFKGIRGKATIAIDEGYLSINRGIGMQSLFLGLKGEKRINIKNISATEIKKSGLTWGYIKFILLGGKENINEIQDENSVTIYNTEQYNNALKIRNYIEQYNSNK